MVAGTPRLRRVSAEQSVLAVLGAPISHSKSPLLHRAAYAALGLPWEYNAIETTSDALPGFLLSRGTAWRGLSLTMPLKRTVLPLLDVMDSTAELTGGANTVLFDDRTGTRTIRGFNTDVYGIVEAFRGAGIDHLETVQLLGSGATAASALLAISRLGAKQVLVSARTPAHAGGLRALGETLGMRLEVSGLDAVRSGTLQSGAVQSGAAPDAVISTIPSGADRTVSFRDETMWGSMLFEVAYDPWPTPLAASWLAAGGRVVHGLEMLLHQAVGQVRVFVGGDPEIPLPNESVVVGAMRHSIAFD
jgi:shikimate dehydrogenase